MTIDVHGHISPPESLRRYPMPRALGDVEGMIEQKLRHGVTLTVVGSPVGAGAMVPLPGVDNYAQPEDRLRAFHDWFAETVQRYPQHLRAYVYVNPFGGQAHLEQAARTAASPEFVGLIANSSVSGRYLNDPAAADFFAMASELDLPILVHAPAAPAAGTGLTDFLLIEQLGRFCDVTIGMACLVLGGWLDRYPNLRVIAATAGGALGLLAEKLDLAWSAPHWGRAVDLPGAAAGRPTLANAPSSYLHRVFVDTSTPSRAALEVNLAVFGADRMLFGTDSPPLPHHTVAGALAAVDGLPLDEGGRRAVLTGNARTLFGSRLPAR